MKVAVIGSRGFADKALLEKTLEGFNIIVLVSGGAVGADTLAEAYADNRGIEKLIFKPEYNKYPPKIAPLMRNETIVRQSDMVIAFWDGQSRGTMNAVKFAKKLGKPVHVFEYVAGKSLVQGKAAETGAGKIEEGGRGLEDGQLF